MWLLLVMSMSRVRMSDSESSSRVMLSSGEGCSMSFSRNASRMKSLRSSFSMYRSNWIRCCRSRVRISVQMWLIRTETLWTILSSSEKSLLRISCCSYSDSGWLPMRKNRSNELIHISSSNRYSAFLSLLSSSSHSLSECVSGERVFSPRLGASST